MLAWHFCREDRKTRWNDQPIEVGKTLTHGGPLVLCESGLHASIRAIDALEYAPGPVICRVELDGEIVTGDDKVVASKRTVIAMADATETLWTMSRWSALQVIHLWDAPSVVREFLETGSESLRAAAWAAAWAAAVDAAVDAAGDAAWAAARAAARAAAWAAAWAAARAAAVDAAGDAARAAARAAQNIELERLFKQLLNCE